MGRAAGAGGGHCRHPSPAGICRGPDDRARRQGGRAAESACLRLHLRDVVGHEPRAAQPRAPGHRSCMDSQRERDRPPRPRGRGRPRGAGPGVAARLRRAARDRPPAARGARRGAHAGHHGARPRGVPPARGPDARRGGTTARTSSRSPRARCGASSWTTRGGTAPRGGAAAARPVDARRRGGRARGARGAPELLVDARRGAVRLAALDARQARVVECRFFGGLTEEETAEALGVGLRTVKRDWAKARGWLYRELPGRGRVRDGARAAAAEPAGERFRRADAVLDAALDLRAGGARGVRGRAPAAATPRSARRARLLRAHERRRVPGRAPSGGGAAAGATRRARRGRTRAARRLQRALGGRYRVERELGAAAWRRCSSRTTARHERAGRAQGPATRSAGAALGAERFLAEIRVTARLQHPTCSRCSTRARRTGCSTT